MRRPGLILAMVCVVMAAGAFAGQASAATVAGSNCAANTSSLGSVVSLKNPPGYPLPSAIPSAGVITSWTFNLGLSLPAELGVSEQLKVFAPTGVSNQLKVVGESSPSSVGVGATTLPTRIPVQNGDLLGSIVVVSHEGKVEQGALYCETKDPGDEIGLIGVDPEIGETVTPATTETGFQNPVTVTVEPDADGDGFGDETQDKCPTDASTQGPCPAPPVPPAPPKATLPISLSASAAAKKGLVIVTLTSSAQATVTVGGSVKIGTGKTAKLAGSTQIVAPGSLAKFTILFPAALKAALKKTPASKKLTLSLSASAPGATTTNFTVKVPGQMKPARKPHHSG
jgi:hypothetical protein